MGKFSSPKKPATPDPNVVSAAQTRSNQETAAYEAALNRQNVFTPFGSQTFTQNGKDPTTGAPIWDQNIKLDPRMQGVLDQQLDQNARIGDMSSGMLDNVSSTYGKPMDTGGAPALQGGYGSAYDPNSLPGMQSSYDIKGPALQGSIDMSNMPELYGSSDLLGARQQTQDALYKQQTQYLDPQYAQRENDFRTRMLNQGVVEGSEAFKNALDDENRAKEFSYGNARNSAISGSGEEMERLAGIAAGNRNQTFGERSSGAQFTNNARGQAAAEAMNAAGFNNQARAQGFNEQGVMTDANARAASFGNTARSQGLDEQYRARALPMQEYAAMRGLSPVETPEFSSPPVAGVAPTDVSGNQYRSYQGLIDMYNAGQAGQNSMFGGLIGAAGNMGAAWMSSDERLKTDLEPIGEIEPGLPIYEYTMKRTGERQRGVMAQDMEKIDPKAVKTGKDGFKKVNYSRVLARAMAA